MEQVDVIAVVGGCAPERAGFAREAARHTGRMLVPAQRLRMARDPVLEAVSLAPWCSRAEGVLVEFPESTDVTEVIAATAAPGAGTSLTGVLSVVDASHLLADLHREDCVIRPRRPRAGPRHVARALLTVMGLELASTVVLVNWEARSTRELSTVLALVNHLGPRARLRLHHGGQERWLRELPARGEGYDVTRERSGWVTLLHGDHDPYMTDPRVSAVHYENVRPLHPGRLQHLLDHRVEAGEFGTVLRSAGFCRFATRPHLIARWNHVGRMICFSPLTRDQDLEEGHELLALGQDLGIIGLDLRVAALRTALDDAVLTDDEFAAGPAAWSRFADPFPAWPTVSDRAD